MYCMLKLTLPMNEKLSARTFTSLEYLSVKQMRTDSGSKTVVNVNVTEKPEQQVCIYYYSSV